MTIKELNKQIDELEAQTADMPETNLQERIEKRRMRTVWLAPSEMPRSIRPIAIKANWEILDINGDVAEINFDKARKFMYDIFPVDVVAEFTGDEHAYQKALQKTIRTMRYGIERLYEVDPDSGERRAYWRASISAQDFAIAWEPAWATTKKGVKPRPRRAKPTTTEILYLEGDTQISITAQNYQFALYSKPNPYAYIQVMPDGFFSKAKWNKDGSLKNDMPTEEATGEDYDVPLLHQILTAAFAASRQVTAYTITVYLPDFCANMNIDFNAHNANDILAKIETFDKCVGVVDGGSRLYKVLSVAGYDGDTKLLTLVVPYINLILSRIASDMKNSKRYKKKLAAGTTPDLIPGYYSWLVHADIVTERNKSAAAIAYIIIAALLRRGASYKKTERGTFEYSVAFSTLIDDVPQFKARLDKSTTANKNNILRRTFTAVYKILRDKTDLYKYFIDLQIQQTIPTASTINTNLVIEYSGRNSNFKGTMPKAK